jgi:hypothetical protein
MFVAVTIFGEKNGLGSISIEALNGAPNGDVPTSCRQQLENMIHPQFM